MRLRYNLLNALATGCLGPVGRRTGMWGLRVRSKRDRGEILKETGKEERYFVVCKLFGGDVRISNNN